VKKAWWLAPLSLAGAGLASVTLSACYGPGCLSTVTLLDGGIENEPTPTCAPYDCNTAAHDDNWSRICLGVVAPAEDGGTDGGTDGGH
jgi:hypothetical protein